MSKGDRNIWYRNICFLKLVYYSCQMEKIFVLSGHPFFITAEFYAWMHITAELTFTTENRRLEILVLMLVSHLNLALMGGTSSNGSAFGG